MSQNSSPSTRLASAAKINLDLYITAKLANNYHQVSTTLLRLPFYDYLTLSPASQNQLSISSRSTAPKSRYLPIDDSNLILIALVKLQNKFPLPNFHLELEKNIPFGSGLGGGTFNAATLINYLIKKYALSLDNHQLQDLGLTLGADFPFALSQNPITHEQNHGLSSLQTTSLPSLPPCQIVLFTQKYAFSSAQLYGEYQISSTAKNQSTSLQAALQQKDLNAIAAHLHNDFTPLILNKKPALQKLWDNLQTTTPLGLNFTGKGPTLFALYPLTQKLDFSTINPQLYQQIHHFIYPTPPPAN